MNHIGTRLGYDIMHRTDIFDMNNRLRFDMNTKDSPIYIRLLLLLDNACIGETHGY